MANWISYIKDDLGSGDDTRDGMITNGPTHGVQLSQELPPLVGFTTIGSSGTLHVAGTLKLDGQLKDGDNAFGTSGQVLSSDGTDTRWVSSGELAAGAASQVAINDDSNTDAERFITLVDSSSGNNSVKTDASLKYNPSTNTITTVNITGNVTGNITGDLTGDVTGNISGNAGTATVLQTARTIGGVSFNGSAAINLPGVNQAGNQNTSGNAATATKLAAAINIGGVSFDGSAAINLPGVNQAGNQNTSGNAATATVLETQRAFSITGDITANAINFNGNGAVELQATIDNGVVDEANLNISNGGTDGQFLQKQSGNSGGLTWATVDTSASGLSGTTLASGVTASSLTSVGTLGQNLLIDNGTSTLVNVRCDNGGNAIVRAGGEGQGTGVFEVSQDNGSHGGGISYNGDGSPSFVSGESSDHVTFYRISGGTRTEVFHYPYNGNVVNFNSVPTVGGTNLARTTDNITGSSASCTGNAATSSSCSGNSATATTASACSGNSVTATTATNANNVKIRTDNDAAWHYPLFVDSNSDNQNQTIKVDASGMKYYPSLGWLQNNAFQSYYMYDWAANVGSAGQVLTSQGSSNQWSWTTPFSGSYNDLSSKPTIPTNNNQLTNGAGYITSAANYQKFTSSGTWSKPSSGSVAIVYMWGGGGGGGNGQSYKGGGGGGSYAQFVIPMVYLSSSESVTVGSGGGQNSNGGTSQFKNSDYQACGGSHGVSGNYSNQGGNGGQGGTVWATGGGATGGRGEDGTNIAPQNGSGGSGGGGGAGGWTGHQPGGHAWIAGAGGGGRKNNSSQVGGQSKGGGNGGQGTGSNGTAPGGGGGGGGGSGGRGEVIVVVV